MKTYEINTTDQVFRITAENAYVDSEGLLYFYANQYVKACFKDWENYFEVKVEVVGDK